MPVFKQEDVWCSAAQGITALCDLSTEQKDSNHELVQHHYTLVTILHAILVFSLKSVKPLSLFDTKVSLGHENLLSSYNDTTCSISDPLPVISGIMYNMRTCHTNLFSITV